MLAGHDKHVRFTTGTFQVFKLLERDAQVSDLMAFERPVQALLEQFIQRSLGCALGLFGFAFPKHTSLLLDAVSEKQTVFSGPDVRCRV